jgi:hypothetical protein
MSDEQIQTEKKAQKSSQSYLDDSSPLTESSDINEEFYRIKASQLPHPTSLGANAHSLVEVVACVASRGDLF